MVDRCQGILSESRGFYRPGIGSVQLRDLSAGWAPVVWMSARVWTSAGVWMSADVWMSTGVWMSACSEGPGQKLGYLVGGS